MKSTALGAENIIFISDAHEKFYYEKLQEVRYQDVYHKALCYCLGINGDTRKNADRIYNFKTGSVKTKCLHEGWQTSGSLKVVRMAFNLYCNSTPTGHWNLPVDRSVLTTAATSGRALIKFPLSIWGQLPAKWKSAVSAPTRGK